MDPCGNRESQKSQIKISICFYRTEESRIFDPRLSDYLTQSANKHSRRKPVFDHGGRLIVVSVAHRTASTYPKRPLFVDGPTNSTSRPSKTTNRNPKKHKTHSRAKPSHNFAIGTQITIHRTATHKPITSVLKTLILTSPLLSTNASHVTLFVLAFDESIVQFASITGGSRR